MEVPFLQQWLLERGCARDSEACGWATLSGSGLQEFVPLLAVRGRQAASAGLPQAEGLGATFAGGIGVIAAADGAGLEVGEPCGSAGGQAGGGSDEGRRGSRRAERASMAPSVSSKRDGGASPGGGSQKPPRCLRATLGRSTVAGVGLSAWLARHSYARSGTCWRAGVSAAGIGLDVAAC